MDNKRSSHQEVLQSLLETDDEGQEKINKAEEESQQIIKEAEEQKQAVIDQARKEANDEADEIISNAENAAQDAESQEKIAMNGIAMDREQFQRKAEQNMDKAVDALVRWVRGKKESAWTCAGTF